MGISKFRDCFAHHFLTLGGVWITKTRTKKAAIVVAVVVNAAVVVDVGVLIEVGIYYLNDFKIFNCEISNA